MSIAPCMLVIILTVFFVKGVFITQIHNPFTGHDEVAHYAYLQIVATEGRVPLIPDPAMWKAPDAVANPNAFDRIPSYFWKYCQFSTQDWSGCGDNQCPDSCYLHFDKTDGKIMPTGWIYTANHPPLYYLMMTPLYWLTEHQTPEEQLTWFRYAAIPFGMLTVLFAYLTVRALFPNDPRQFLAITVPAIVAFQPQVSYEAAMLNNDILAIALTSAVIWLTAIGLRKRFPVWNCVLIGTVLGLALLAKTTSMTVAALIAVAMILGLGWRNWRSWMPCGVIAATMAGFVSWPWFLYMYLKYGDFTALNRIHALQWWNYSDVPAPTIWAQMTDREFVWRIWGQTWGGFGWHLILLSDDLLRILFYVALFGAWGLALYIIRVTIPEMATT
ncbi:MAG: ArnT family glycosyltransferase, partial [Thermomicrobiales bacterium]